jgi:hypothetical protein
LYACPASVHHRRRRFSSTSTIIGDHHRSSIIDDQSSWQQWRCGGSLSAGTGRFVVVRKMLRGRVADSLRCSMQMNGSTAFVAQHTALLNAASLSDAVGALLVIACERE